MHPHERCLHVKRLNQHHQHQHCCCLPFKCIHLNYSIRIQFFALLLLLLPFVVVVIAEQHQLQNPEQLPTNTSPTSTPVDNRIVDGEASMLSLLTSSPTLPSSASEGDINNINSLNGNTSTGSLLSSSTSLSTSPEAFIPFPDSTKVIADSSTANINGNINTTSIPSESPSHWSPPLESASSLSTKSSSKASGSSVTQTTVPPLDSAQIEPNLPKNGIINIIDMKNSSTTNNDNKNNNKNIELSKMSTLLLSPLLNDQQSLSSSSPSMSSSPILIQRHLASSVLTRPSLSAEFEADDEGEGENEEHGETYKSDDDKINAEKSGLGLDGDTASEAKTVGQGSFATALRRFRMDNMARFPPRPSSRMKDDEEVLEVMELGDRDDGYRDMDGLVDSVGNFVLDFFHDSDMQLILDLGMFRDLVREMNAVVKEKDTTGIGRIQTILNLVEPLWREYDISAPCVADLLHFVTTTYNYIRVAASAAGNCTDCQCSAQYRSQVRQYQWIFDVVDAMGKIPAALVSGNNLWTGSWYTCRKISVVKNRQGQLWRGQYCMARFQPYNRYNPLKAFAGPPADPRAPCHAPINATEASRGGSNRFEDWTPDEQRCFDFLPLLNIGLCTPETCTDYDVKKVIQFVYRSAELLLDRALVCDVLVQCSNDRPENQLANNRLSLVVLGVLLAVFTLVLFGTCYDVYSVDSVLFSRARSSSLLPTTTAPLRPGIQRTEREETEWAELTPDQRKSGQQDFELTAIQKASKRVQETEPLVTEKVEYSSPVSESTGANVERNRRIEREKILAERRKKEKRPDDSELTVIDDDGTDKEVHLKKRGIMFDSDAGVVKNDEKIEAAQIRTERRRRPQQPKLVTVARMFSAKQNLRYIFATGSREEGQIQCLHGLRFFSMSWIIFGHTYYYIMTSLTTDNVLQTLRELPKYFYIQLVVQAPVAVDSFFFLSGLLTSYIFLKKLKKHQFQLNSAKTWFAFYARRFLRLTPVYFIILLIDIALFPYASDGPFWKPIEVDFCRTSWWANLLYINNFIDQSTACMGWTWYLANDFQLYSFAPILLIALHKSKLGGVLLGLGVIAASSAYNLFITIVRNYPPAPLLTTKMQIIEILGQYWTELYIKPYIRCVPYIVGCLVGHILVNKTRNGDLVSSSPSTGTRSVESRSTIRLSTAQWVTGWTCCAVLGTYSVFGLYEYTKTGEISDAWAWLYTLAGRLSFAICLGWVVFACETHHGKPVNAVLGHKMFVPLSKLTFCAYLLHPMLLQLYYFSRPTAFHFTNAFQMLHMFLTAVFMSYAAALLFSIAFEVPVMHLDRLIFGGGAPNAGKRRQQQSVPVDQQAGGKNDRHHQFLGAGEPTKRISLPSPGPTTKMGPWYRRRRQQPADEDSRKSQQKHISAPMLIRHPEPMPSTHPLPSASSSGLGAGGAVVRIEFAPATTRPDSAAEITGSAQKTMPVAGLEGRTGSPDPIAGCSSATN